MRGLGIECKMEYMINERYIAVFTVVFVYGASLAV